MERFIHIAVASMASIGWAVLVYVVAEDAVAMAARWHLARVEARNGRRRDG